jgi:hypothetical protein
MELCLFSETPEEILKKSPEMTTYPSILLGLLL